MRNGTIKNHHLVLKCKNCGNIFAKEAWNFRCPKCSSNKTRYIKYESYMLKEFGIKPKPNVFEGY